MSATAMTGPRTRLRVTRRGRAVLTTLAAAPLVALALAVVLGGGGAAAETARTAGTAATRVAFEYVTVATGDTLWELAERIAPKSDPRVVIDDIMRLNGLDDAEVAPGQRLALPPELPSEG